MNRRPHDQPSISIEFEAPGIRHARNVEVKIYGTNDPKAARSILEEWLEDFAKAVARSDGPREVLSQSAIGAQHARIRQVYKN